MFTFEMQRDSFTVLNITDMQLWMTTEYNDYFINLDVLADNPAAISLYKKYGFEITESYKGFSLIESARPDCLHMVRKPI